MTFLPQYVDNSDFWYSDKLIDIRESEYVF